MMPLRARALVAGCTMVVAFGACSSDGALPDAATSSVATTTSSLPATPSTSTTSTTPPTTGAAPASTEPLLGFVERTAAFVDELISHGQFSGVVLIADGDEVVWERAAGQAVRESNTPNRITTRFNLGSMNKMFTAVAVLQLMERGLLALDGTIDAYLPGYPNEAVAEAVTVEHLLTHTSGLGDVFTAEFEADPHRYRTNADYLPLFGDEPLETLPGTRFSYSNAGYVVLGLIVEHLTGADYADHLRTSVFEPAGMLDTGLFDVDADVPDLAVGYTFLDIHGNSTGVLAPNTPIMPGRGFAAGGGYSTAEDLLSFRNALFGGRLVRPESLDLLIGGRVVVGDDTRYGYGFFDQVESGRRVVGHTGGAPGVCSFINIYPETGHTVVVLSNRDDHCLPILLHLRDHPPVP